MKVYIVSVCLLREIFLDYFKLTACWNTVYNMTYSAWLWHFKYAQFLVYPTPVPSLTCHEMQMCRKRVGNFVEVWLPATGVPVSRCFEFIGCSESVRHIGSFNGYGNLIKPFWSRNWPNKVFPFFHYCDDHFFKNGLENESYFYLKLLYFSSWYT